MVGFPAAPGCFFAFQIDRSEDAVFIPAIASTLSARESVRPGPQAQFRWPAGWDPVLGPGKVNAHSPYLRVHENQFCFSLPEVGDGKLEDSGSGLHLNFGHYLLKSANEN